jgi:hypothetical protein
MKYDEQNIKQILRKQSSCGQPEDLDWFDSELVEKLQRNKLPADEKQKLITMMANDQSMMKRYLSLKKETIIVESWLSKFMRSKLLQLTTIRLSLILVLIILFNNNTLLQNIDTTIVRGATQTSIYPINKSTLRKAPDYFIAQNKNTDNISISLFANNQVLWSSDYQKSNKFYLPIHIKNQLETGQYNWAVNNNNNEINESYSFTIR